MGKKDNVFHRYWDKAQPFLQKTGAVFSAIGRAFRKTGRFIFLIRKLLLAVPVVLGAFYVVQYTKERLPSQVGLLIQESGAYTYVIDQDVAITGCIAVTAACMLMMFLSRRTVYPWLISLFSLVLPLLLLLTNIFPA